MKQRIPGLNKFINERKSEEDMNYVIMKKGVYGPALLVSIDGTSSTWVFAFHKAGYTKDYELAKRLAKRLGGIVGSLGKEIFKGNKIITVQ